MPESVFTKTNLDRCLQELGREYRRRNKHGTPAEIVLIGGAAVLAGYGFRDSTYDIDAIILAASTMKEAIHAVGDRRGLPNGWLNADFARTRSYSDKLREVSVYYKTFSNVLEIRMVAAEYLVAMKLMSGRQYKRDLSDVAGILLEHQRQGKPLSREGIDSAIAELYGEKAALPEAAQVFIRDLFENGDYERTFGEIREHEQQARTDLLEFEQKYPNAQKSENVDVIIERAKRKRAEG